MTLPLTYKKREKEMGWGLRKKKREGEKEIEIERLCRHEKNLRYETREKSSK